MKTIEKYIHLYPEVQLKLINEINDDFDDDMEIPSIGSIGKLKLINNGDFSIYCGSEAEEWKYGVSFEKGDFLFWDLKDLKPLLRNLTDMNIEERSCFQSIKKIPDEIVYLLSIHIDLFGLMEAGLAIDINKI